MSLQQRLVVNYISKRFPGPLSKYVLTTNDTVQRELLNSFQLYAEVKDVAHALLNTYSHPSPATSYPRFQAYVRQAISFHDAAEKLHYRASPLLYYYSFMNFAKAIIFARDHTFTTGHIIRGIQPPHNTGMLRQHFVTVRVPGVFSHLYKYAVRQSIYSGAKFSVMKLLGYVSDVGQEYQEFKYGSPLSVGCKYAVVQYNDFQGCRGLLAVNTPTPTQRRYVEKLLSKGFTEVSVIPGTTREVFELTAEDAQVFTFWETKKVYGMPNPMRSMPVAEIVNESYRTWNGYFSLNPYDEPFLFRLNKKIQTPKQVPMNEMIAIYIVTYYLGSLVKYRPEVLERMLARRDAWMLESFIRSTPTTFLRYARNLLDGRNFVYKQR